MLTISRFGVVRHLRSGVNQHVLHYRNGTLVRHGVGLAYWFNPLRAGITEVPAHDCETVFGLHERSADFQEINVQMTVTYRFQDPVGAAARCNFSVSLETGAWTDEPLTRVDAFWVERAQQPARAYIASVSLVEALKEGAEYRTGPSAV